MAEEESGFTFVDKRRAAGAAVADSPPVDGAQVGPGLTGGVSEEAPAPENTAEIPGAETEGEIPEPQMAGEMPGSNPEAGFETSADGESRAETAGGEEAEAPDVYALASYCLQLFAQEAWQKMGLIGDPRTGLVVKDLEQAKVAIDLVSDIAAKLDAAPEDRIPQRLKRDLRTLLNDLRLNYVSQRGGAVVPPA